MLPDGLVNVEEPLHDPDELAAGGGTVTGTAGTGAAGSAGAGPKGTAAPPEEYEASKPRLCTEPSAENTASMLPEVAVTEPGMLLPLNSPSRAPPLLLEPP